MTFLFKLAIILNIVMNTFYQSILIPWRFHNWLGAPGCSFYNAGYPSELTAITK